MGRDQRRAARRLAAVVAAAVTTALVSCTSPPAPLPTPTPSASAMRPACAGDDPGTYWLPPGADADAGAVLILGSGDRGVLLVPQSDGDICQWVGQARQLVASGYRVAMMNWGDPPADSVVAAFEQLRATGARRTVLVGASMGGAYALDVAAQVAPDAVVTFSADPGASGVEIDAQLARYHGPVLFVGSRDDGYAPEGVTRHLAAVHPGPEQVLVLGGEEHGIVLLSVEDRVQTAFDRFLATHLGR